MDPLDDHEAYLSRITALVKREHETKQRIGLTESLDGDQFMPTSSFPGQSEITLGDRDETITWLYEVSAEQHWKLDQVVKAAKILDTFLRICRIKRSQLQLASVASMILAKKYENCDDQRDFNLVQDPENKEIKEQESMLISYASNSIRSQEVRAWEMLLLSKLDWNIGSLVTVCDFFHSLFPPMMRMTSCDLWHENSILVASLVSRNVRIVEFTFPTASIAMAAMKVSSANEDDLAITDDILRALRVTRENVERCCEVMEQFLWNILPAEHNEYLTSSTSTSVMMTQKSPEKRSPMFKITSASTPKTSREADGSSGAETTREVARLKRKIFEEDNKENTAHNDSAIGLNTTKDSCATSTSPNPPTSSSSSSSKTSSPDSGASSNSPGNMVESGAAARKELDDIEEMIKETTLEDNYM